MAYPLRAASNRFAKFRRLLALTLAAIVSLLALSAMAPSTAQAETLADPIVISDPTQDQNGDGWSWVSAGSSGTLTLDGLDMNLAEENNAPAITVPDGATIELVGENVIITDVASSAGIYCDGSLIITGESNSSLSITANGLSTGGIVCTEDLSIGAIELVVNASTVEDDTESIGISVGGNAVVNQNATVSSTGSDCSLQVAGSLNITDACLVELMLENSETYSVALSVGGETMISEVTDEVILAGGGAVFSGEVTISGTKLSGEFLPSPNAGDTYQTMLFKEGANIVNGSTVRIDSYGDAVEALGDVLVQNSSLACYSQGERSAAIRLLECDLTADNSTIYAFGDDSSGSVGILLYREMQDGAFDGYLILQSNVDLIAEGAQAGFVAWSGSEQWEDDPIAVDPEIGVVEGGMLSYAENASSEGAFISAWTYSDEKTTVGFDGDDVPFVENASNRVEFRTEPISIFVTDEGEPVSGLTSIKAIADDGTEYQAIEWLDGTHSGYYRFSEDLPEGDYAITVGEGYEAEGAVMTVGSNPTIYSMDFCTVEIDQVDNVWTWAIAPSTGERVSIIEHILIGSEVELGARLDEGYAFVGYTATGIAPTWENDDTTKADQTVIINGSTVITSSVEAVDDVPEANDDNDGSTVSEGTDDSSTVLASATNGGSATLAKTGDSSTALIGAMAAFAAAAVSVIAIAARMRRSS